MKKYLFFTFLLTSLIFISCAHKNEEAMQKPESYDDIEEQWLIDLAREDIRTARAKIVDEGMELTEDQKKVFWPIFEQYQNDLNKIGDRRIALLKDYADNYDTMTSKKADELAKGFIDVRMERIKLAKKYYDKLSKSLGSVTAARFLQVDNIINLVIDIQVASEVPLIKE